VKLESSKLESSNQARNSKEKVETGRRDAPAFVSSFDILVSDLILISSFVIRI